MSPYLIHSHGNENKIEKFIAIKPPKNIPACKGLNSPVVRGLALVLSTCLSISLSAKSLIIQPADLVEKAPIVNKEIIFNEGITAGEPKAKPQ